MLQLLQIEVYKIFKRPRTYIAFGVITLIILLLQIALKSDREEYVGMMMSGMDDTFNAPASEILNGYSVCFIVLNLLLVHVPILVALIAGDMISGEANMGTLRLLITKPVSRTRLLLVKFTAASIYTLLMVIWVALLALGLSVVLFGTNELFVPRESEVNIISTGDVLWRYLAAFGFAMVGMITVAALAFMLSVFTDNSIVPIVTTVCVIIIFTILTQIQVPFYDSVEPWLFTTHMLGWKGFFYVEGREGITMDGSLENLRAILKSGLMLLGYITLFLSVAAWYFNRKNILS